MKMHLQTRSVLLILMGLSMHACTSHAQSSTATSESGGTDALLAKFKAAGRNASVTVFPAGIVGRPIRPVGDVVAAMLERAGMPNIQIDAPEFSPPREADLAAIAEAFAAFVGTHPISTNYAVYSDFQGTREKGFTEIRTVIATREGRVVWQDRQTDADADFKRVRPKEPMECCLLVVERLRPLLGLGDPAQSTAPEGPIAQRWAARSGVPDKEEMGAMNIRQDQFRKRAATATLLVLPSRVSGEYDGTCAAHLAAMINEKGLTQARASGSAPSIAAANDMNEQKVLWAMARGMKVYVTQSRPDADYVLFAEYLAAPGSGGRLDVRGVHLAVCDREGNWVIVDFQNSHHDDFRAVRPESREDCDRLVVRRIEKLVR